MKELVLKFYKCIQDSQEYGSNNEHMISLLFFTIDGEEYQCNIRQPYGEDFSFEDSPIEVETPDLLKGKINYGEFREAAEHYYRTLVGSTGCGIRIGPGSKGIRMRNNTFGSIANYRIHEAGPAGGGW